MKIKLPQKQGKWKALCLLLTLNLLAAASFAQIKISGKVTNSKGIGADALSVLVKGTTIGTLTDNAGNYNLTANLKQGKYYLIFTGVGFKSKEVAVTVGSSTSYTINIELNEEISKLDEVIVTGTSQGTTRRQLGSYISSVGADELTKGASGNVLAALQGKTAGAQISQNSGDPAGGISVRLRGISSISGSSEPLYIIDGVIVNNGTNRVTNTQGGYDGTNVVGTIGQSRLVDINPDDIDRIEVLNGAAAAAIYGSRANAGVVQIFTKKGKSGVPTVSFSTNAIFSSLRKKLDVNRAPVKFGGPTDGVGAQTQDILTPALTNTTAVTRYDYQDYIFRNAIGTDNTVSVSGGTDKTKYYLSGSYFFNQGIIQNTDFQRFSFRSNFEQILSKWATFNVGLNYVNSSANEKPDGNSFYSPMNSVTIIGNFHNIWQRDGLGNLLAVGERGRANPISVIEDIKQKQTTNRIIANVGFKLKPIKHLSIDYTMGIDNYSQVGNTYIPPFAYNVSTAFFGGGASLDATQNGYASAATNNFFAINHDVNATYNIDINRNINSVTQVGFSQQYEKNTFQLTQGRGLASFVQTVNGASTAIPGTDDRSEISVSGAFLQQNFKYRNQFFVTGALRIDGSSVFGKDQRNQVYTKASGSYVISSSDYWSKLGVSKWWDLFKIRIAYGESGNLTGIGSYARYNTYASSSFLSRTALNSNSVLANENVKPERQQETEFGIDLSFLANRLGLTVNIYNKQVKDLLINRFIAPTTGFSSLLDNFGTLENKGFEIVFTGTPVSKKNFKWDITGIFNHNRNKALNIGQALNLLSTNAGAPTAILQGLPIGVFYGTFFATDATGNYLKNTGGLPQIEKGTQNTTTSPLDYTVGRDALGQPTGTPLRKVIGNPNPDFTASLVNEITYKKLSFRMQIDAVRGASVFNADFRTRQGVGNGKVAEQEDLGLLPRGYISNIYAIEQWRVDDGAYVKLRELSLSYSIGKIKGINDLSINFAGRNLISWDNYKGYDPEVNAGGQSTLLRGIDFGAVPIPKTFSFGIKAKF
ncbi:MAG: SusC/RagA family TonB-linked outer membrane protein [Flavobacterium sp.]|nr:SusC/RagA family TonB-linked outer membrane protein [Flavobacterium sp.]